ncbi:zinc-binding alcohol dehydrogenase family protein [Kineosporia sp. J2-2]|uniref:Zinc-binding alcohol dehydrogenase family protein n=1 Tax=Kineosporia corallincola TaxID=2835133 RepID=A0ABS5TRB0_9ACTN|nr:zinc-binding alcohol dehydrogenase family protein [Kineosporia corallincola]MBT0773199.1 zinc-binding alcohol dehydrogenase family protein [Kineosporia corallincola]
MKAAVVSSFDAAPRYQDFPLPDPADGELVVDVIATGLHPRVLSQAGGSHYTSTDELPLVPGIDGVGRDREGRLRYFVLPDTPLGAMAEQTVIDARRSIVLPDGTDPVAVAAVMNPAMSSWVALRRRIEFTAGQKVLVLGATGNAGRTAVQVARLFGAGQIVAVGRDPEKLGALTALGATDTVALGEGTSRLGRVAAGVDVVLDYLWGEPATAVMTTLVTDRADRGEPLTWVQIGSMAGPTAAIPSAALRAARLAVVGSGQGSVPTRDILAELTQIAAAVAEGRITVDVTTVPLAGVEQAWGRARDSDRRIVITPQA